MSEIIATGWDGTNPLHLLAALGTLVLAHHEDPGATLAWRWTGRWTPVIEHRIAAWTTPEAAAAAVADRIRNLGATGAVDPVANRRIADLKAERKKIEKARKEALGKLKADKRASAEERRAAMDACAADFDRQLASQDQMLSAAQDTLNDALGVGIAHLGAIIGVPPPLFRRKAESACRDWLLAPSGHAGATPHGLLVAALSAQACDAVSDKGLVTPTPLSFSNGSSGQCLLKDFRSCANACTAADVGGTWNGHPQMTDVVTGLNWDPSDQRSYALQWDSPESGRTHDPAVNALAFIGLSVMTTMPGGARLQAIGWLRTRPDGLRWPIWDVPLLLSVVQSLLAADPTASRLHDRPGVVAVVSSARINPSGKRNFFAPSRPV